MAALTVALLCSASAIAEDEAHPDTSMTRLRPDAQAPLGVRAGHTQSKGEWMLSYRYERVWLDGNRDGSRRRTTEDVRREGFEIVPTEMSVEVHELGLLYAPVDRLTLAVHVPIIRKDMRNKGLDGSAFWTHADGIGDVEVTALVPFMKKGDETLHVSFGMSLPTGSISEDDRGRLGYPMQIGSGTWDVMPGLTYRGHIDEISWGVQLIGVGRIGRNSKGYRQGNEYTTTGWIAGNWIDWASPSLRLEWSQWQNHKGRDHDLDRGETPINDRLKRAGSRLDIGAGLNFVVKRLAGQRFAVELLYPVYQRLNGPQLETDWTLVAGWKWGF